MLSYLYYMLTLLRKIRRSLIKTGKARNYLLYAIGEIILVVIGILIALEVNNWNEAKKLLNKEITVYKEIHSELAETLKDVKDDKQDWEEILNASVRVRDMLVQNNIQEDSLMRYIYRTFDLEQSNPKTSAFESLKSLGLDVLSNDTLRQDITTLYQLTIPSLITSDAAVEAGKIRDKIQPLWEKYLKVDRSAIQGLLASNEPSFRRGRFLNLVNTEYLIKDEPLVLTLQNSLNWRLKVIGIHERVINHIKTIMATIEVEIERLS